MGLREALEGMGRRLGFNIEASKPETYLAECDRARYIEGIMVLASRFTNGEYPNPTGATTRGPTCTLGLWVPGDEASRTVNKGYEGAVIKFGDKEITVGGFGEKKEETSRGGTPIEVNIPHVRLMI